MALPLLLLLGFFCQEERTIDEIMSVDVITLDLLVLDENGAPITDLSKADFQVMENQRPVAIDFFDVIDFRTTNRLPNAEADPMMQTMVLLLDLASSNLPTIRQSLGEIRAFLNQLPQQLPMQMLIYSLDYGMVTQGFSTDQSIVLDDFTQFEVNFLDRREQLPAYHEKFSLISLEREIQNCIPRTVNAPSAWRSSSAVGMARNCMRVAFDRFSAAQNQQSLTLLAGLEKVLDSLARVEGLKTLYLVSPGLSIKPGEAAATLTSRYTQSLNRDYSQTLLGKSGATNTPGVPAGNQGGDPLDFDNLINSRSPRPNNFAVNPLNREIRSLAHMALTTRTVIHTMALPHNYLLDRRGSQLKRAEASSLQIQPAYSNFSQELDEGIKELAHSTGGIHVRESQFQKSLVQRLAQTQFYYVLGYSKPKHRRKGYRNIRIKCSRKGANLSHNRGYFSKKRL